MQVTSWIKRGRAFVFVSIVLLLATSCGTSAKSLSYDTDAFTSGAQGSTFKAAWGGGWWWDGSIDVLWINGTARSLAVCREK